MSPIPFCPSFEPCAKLTPVHVKRSRHRIQNGGGWGPFRRGVQALVRDDRLGDEKEQRGGDEADDGREKERLADVAGLAPVDAARRGALGRHQLVHDAHAEDRSDERMRARGRQSEPPGPEIPHDGRGEEREHHREPGAAPHLKNELHRQERDDSERHCARRDEHADEVPRPRPHDREVRLERVRIDDGGHRVGGIVKAVHELEAERDE